MATKQAGGPVARNLQSRWAQAALTWLLLVVTLTASVGLTVVALRALNLGPQWTWLDVKSCVSRACDLLVLPDFQRFGVPLDLTVSLNPLAAFFLLLIGGLSIAISLFSFQFLRSEPDKVFIAFVYLAFLVSGALFVVANNIFWSLLALECTTLTFGLLVMHQRNDAIAHGEKPDGRHLRAVRTYLIANHIGGAFVAGALLLLAVHVSPASSGVVLDMDKFASGSSSHTPIGEPAASIIFLLAMVGFGIKSGMAPFHVWVAIAHPSSPTNTHAMSLGIMIKIAIFGMIRVFFQFLEPDIKWWWGGLLVGLAALTALVGVRNALYGENLKDSLADHSVENIGIILAGVGLALMFDNHDTLAAVHFPPALAALALVAGLYHLLNHTVFKGLLYVCTGAAYQLTGKENKFFALHRLGGILRTSRVLGTCFVVGSIALAGFPPFNGFISEWLTLQSALVGIHVAATDPGHVAALLSAVLIVGVVLLLGTAFALTAFAFVKIAGEAFLGKTRDPHVEDILATAQETRDQKITPLQNAVMICLAAACLALGMFAWPVMEGLGAVVNQLVPKLSLSPIHNDGALGISISIGGYSATLSQWLLLALAGIFLVAALVAIMDRRLLPSSTRGRPRPAASELSSERLIPLAEGRSAPWTTATKWEPTMQYKSIPFVAPWSEFAEGNSPVGKRTASRKGSTARTPLNERFVTPLSERFPMESPAITSLAGDPEARSTFRWVYAVVIDVLRVLTQRIGEIFHNGQLQRYLSYILLLFVTMLALWILWRAVVQGSFG
jgi:hydrogenase-4 component B